MELNNKKIHIERAHKIQELFQKGKVLVVYGPRRVGKTTLLLDFLAQTNMKYLSESGENIMLQELLGSQDFERILGRVDGYELYVIDEAQYVDNIGMGLKIIIDQRPDITVIATGSSSFDLANKIGEPLVGRKKTITLYPISLYELSKSHTQHELKSLLEELMIYGSYPQVIVAGTQKEKRDTIKEITDSYLLRDVFTLEKIKSPKQLLDLVKLLAFQVGQPVSLNELANETGLNLNTVRRYLDLLEKTFVVIRVGAYARNLRNAIKQKSKYYFWDVGIRNAIIDNFNPLEKRNDIGQLWENFCVVERMKRNAYVGDRTPNYYFFRSYQDKEIDLIEEYNGYAAFECKWSPQKRSTHIPDWNSKYPESEIKIIHRENFLDFLAK